MNFEKVKRDTIMGILSGLVEYYDENEKEIVCICDLKGITTIELSNNKDIDGIIRRYRKDGGIFYYSEYKDNKRHGLVRLINFQPLNHIWKIFIIIYL